MNKSQREHFKLLLAKLVEMRNAEKDPDRKRNIEAALGHAHRMADASS